MHMQLSTIVYRYSSLIECCLSWVNLFFSGFRYSKSNKMLSFIVQVQQKSKPPPLNGLSNQTLFERGFILYTCNGLICLFVIDFFISYCINFFYIFRFDPKVLDVLLSEVVLLNTRTELFLRFFRRRAVVSHNTVEMID